MLTKARDECKVANEDLSVVELLRHSQFSHQLHHIEVVFDHTCVLGLGSDTVLSDCFVQLLHLVQRGDVLGEKLLLHDICAQLWIDILY